MTVKTHLYWLEDGVHWPISIDFATFNDNGILHAVAVGPASASTRRKTRDAACGRRVALSPVTVVSGQQTVVMPWPPPARNPLGNRCPTCFAAGPRRPDWTWKAWAKLVEAAAR